MIFTLSIEETEGKSYQHGFHLGTDETLARQIVTEKMQAFRTYSLPVVSMALIRDRKIVDVLYIDGTWQNATGEA